MLSTTNDKQIYIIGSLRNPKIPFFAERLRQHPLGFSVFDDWYAAGPEADDYWQKYEQDKGNTLAAALAGKAAQNVLAFDQRNLDASIGAILVMPAGKSGHLELGYMRGTGKKTGVLFPEGQPERWDVMYAFADKVWLSAQEMLDNIAVDWGLNG